MQPYANNNEDSGIISYQIGDNFIIIQFKSGKNTFYKYTYSSAGRMKIEKMKELAKHGSGLNSYISSKETRPQHEISGISLEFVL